MRANVDYDKKKFVCDSVGDLYPVGKRKSIADFPGYYITENGFVWSSAKKGSSKVGMWIKPFINVKTGYPTIVLRKNNWSFRRTIHTLVLEAFVGKRPKKMECRHLNGNRQDCRMVNLKWGTHSENVRDAIRHGTLKPKFYVIRKGAEHCNSKLVDKNIREIRLLSKQGVRQNKLAKLYEVSNAVINGIVHNRTWKHVN